MALDDYESDDGRSKATSSDHEFSLSTLALLEQLKPTKAIEGDEEVEDRTKVIFCSRTHSQLAQFVNELRKINLPSAVSDVDDDEEVIKHISLGSRKNLCINPKVSKLVSTTAINERCLELQKPGISQDHKCEFLPSQRFNEDKERLDSFKDNAIAQVQDIEDIASLGRRMKLCPYYASRSTIPVAEVLTLPYPLLLQKSARQALGVIVKDNVVIVDEAHNLTSAIADTMSVSMPLSHLELAHKQLMGYCQKFKNRLKGKNRVYIAQIIRLLKACISQLQAHANMTTDTTLPMNNLILNAGVDQIQPHKLVKYIQESKLVYKVEGYAVLLDQSSANSTSVSQKQLQPKGVLAEFQNLMIALMNPSPEGRFFILRGDRELVLKYSLLDPQAHFEDIVREARAVILAGGTMSPMSDYSDQLFPYLESAKLKTYSFGHIIDKDNVLVKPLAKGRSGIEFDFTWQNRQSRSMVLELATVIEKLCMVTPDGMVVFFPSYDYLAFVASIWRSGNNSPFSKISSHKKPFEESKDVNVDDLLRDYANTIAKGKGALMLAVVGGKLSEGINFSDRLGRVVICVGLPYPNIKSAEWKAKVEYIERTKYLRCREEGLSEAECKSRAQAAGREYADNATMRAVNQSIGRAIRHKNDYAAIFLVDKRYATPRIQAKLPTWLKDSMCSGQESWQETENNCAQFFASKV